MQTVKLKDICAFEKGSIGLAKAESGEYPLVTTAAERKTCNTFQFDTKAVCIPLVSSTGHGHASLNNVHYQEGKFALGTILVALTSNDESKLDIQFLHLYLSQLKNQVLVPLMTGAANVALSVTKIQNISIPLPSLRGQREIVEKFKSIVSEEEELKSELISQLSLIKKLQQQILQEAIEGKLTSGWRANNPSISPARELLKIISDKKLKKAEDKVARKQKPQPAVSKVDELFRLPEGWEWGRLGQLFSFIDYRGKTPNKIDKGIRLITAKNVRKGYLSLQPEEFISSDEFDSRMTRGFPQAGDLLFTTEAPLGNVCILDIEETISTGQRLITFQSVSAKLENKLFMLFLLSPLYQKYLLENATGVTAKGIKAGKLKEMLVPLPPEKEQQVIVTKVEKLLDFCDQLEEKVRQNQIHAKQLMQSVLNEAFSKHNDCS